MNEDQYTNINVESVISILQSLTLKGDSVDGETMEYILERVGMTDQMLRQLVMNNPQSDTIDLLNEKMELHTDELDIFFACLNHLKYF
jgi:hypothetical protein